MSIQQRLDVDIRFSPHERAEPERALQAIATSDGLNQRFTSGSAWDLEPGARRY